MKPTPRTPLPFLLLALAAAGAVLPALQAAEPEEPAERQQQPADGGVGELLDALGAAAPEPASAAGDATPGYVPDARCAPCHRNVFTSYRTVGMSRSFYRPTAENRVEDFENAHYYHPPSDRHYEMVEDGDRLFLERYREGPGGEKLDLLRREVTWVLGSGSTSRSYVHQTEWGELYQLPIAWYSQTRSWGMAPGYDRPDHKGFTRRIQRDCMFCHNAYPDVPAGADEHGAPQTFPEELPQGIGCQRCHGPGAEHLRVALDLDASSEKVQSSIVNPARLPPERREEVCMQCHLQPSVALSGVRRFDRPMYSFRPGQPLGDYLVLMDVVEDRDRVERFEINHHPYRLRQSRCYQESGGALSCLTCHDPHHKPAGQKAVAQYRDACLSCHDLDQCDLQQMTDRSGLPEVAADNCAACHMPRRRTEDVVQVVMTDHLIRRRPGGPELTAPIEENDPRIRTVVFLDPEEAPEGPIAEVYRQLAMVRSGSQAALDRLATALAEAEPDSLEPYLELAVGQLGAGRFTDAQKTLEPLLLRAPEDPTVHLHLGVAVASQGRAEEALGHLRRAVELAPDRPETRYNLGKLLLQLRRTEEAAGHLQAAVDLRPLLAPGWLDLGNARAQLGQFQPAAEAYRQALAVDPTLDLARRNLVEALLRLDRRGEAVAELQAWLHFQPDDAYARARLGELQGS
jgi:tetratricopeptide (TPR) repeat protein